MGREEKIWSRQAEKHTDEMSEEGNECKKPGGDKRGGEKNGSSGGRYNTGGDKKTGCSNCGKPGYFQRLPKTNHLSQVQVGGS